MDARARGRTCGTGESVGGRGHGPTRHDRPKLFMNQSLFFSSVMRVLIASSNAAPACGDAYWGCEALSLTSISPRTRTAGWKGLPEPLEFDLSRTNYAFSRLPTVPDRVRIGLAAARAPLTCETTHISRLSCRHSTYLPARIAHAKILFEFACPSSL